MNGVIRFLAATGAGVALADLATWRNVPAIVQLWVAVLVMCIAIVILTFRRQ